MNKKFPVKEICEKNRITVETVKEKQVKPENSCKTFEIIASDETHYLLSFYLDRNEPVNLKDREEKVKTEVFFYKNSEVNTPNIIDSDKEKYILVEKIKGIKTINKFKTDYSESIAEDMALLSSKIHSSKEFETFGSLVTKERSKSWKNYFQRYISILDSSTETQLEKEGLTYLKDNLFLLERDFDSVLIHGDLHPWNTVNLSSEGYGVVDGEGSLAAPREFDLAQSIVAWADKFDVTDVFVEAYESKNDLKTGWKDRLNYYRVFWLLSGIINAKYLGWIELVEEFEPRLEERLEDF